MYLCYQNYLDGGLRGGVTKKKRDNFAKIPKRGGGSWKKIPNFSLGNWETQGGGLNFSKMSELEMALRRHPKKGE